jgi:dynein heavy chain
MIYLSLPEILFLHNLCSRSLFEKDKLLFAFVLSSKLLIDRQRMNPAELRFLLTGGVAVGELSEANPDPSWISDKMWGEMNRASDLGET